MRQGNTKISQVLCDACESDVVIKMIFDNIRNIGIAGFVLAASKWYIKQPPQNWLSVVMSLVLSVVGVFLLFANLWHFSQKLRALPFPLLVRNILATVYGLVFSALLMFLASRP